MPKTPVKKDKEESKQSTPRTSKAIRPTLTPRATRTSTKALTEDKKQDREARKDDALVTRRRTPRRPKGDNEISSENEDRASEDERRVKWLDNSTEVSESESEIEGEEDGTQKIENAYTEEDTAKENGKEDLHAVRQNGKEHKSVESQETKDEDSSEDQKNSHDTKPARNSPTKSKPSEQSPKRSERIRATTTNTTVQSEGSVATADEETDGVEPEDSIREQAILERYNEEWVKENQRRTEADENERRKRNRAAKRIDSQFQQAMAAEYRLRQSIQSQSSDTGTSHQPLPVIHTTVKVTPDDSEDDEDQPEFVSHLKNELETVKSILVEKDLLLENYRVKEQEIAEKSTTLANVLRELDEQSKRNLAATDPDIENLKAHNARLEADLERIKEEQAQLGKDQEVDVSGRKFVEDLAEQLEKASKELEEEKKKLEENKDVIHITSAALDAQNEMLEQERVLLRQYEQKLMRDNRIMLERVEAAERKAAEMESKLESELDSIQKRVDQGVKMEFRRRLRISRMKREEEEKAARQMQEEEEEREAMRRETTNVLEEEDRRLFDILDRRREERELALERPEDEGQETNDFTPFKGSPTSSVSDLRTLGTNENNSDSDTEHNEREFGGRQTIADRDDSSSHSRLPLDDDEEQPTEEQPGEEQPGEEQAGEDNSNEIQDEAVEDIEVERRPHKRRLIDLDGESSHEIKTYQPTSPSSAAEETIVDVIEENSAKRKRSRLTQAALVAASIAVLGVSKYVTNAL